MDDAIFRSGPTLRVFVGVVWESVCVNVVWESVCL